MASSSKPRDIPRGRWDGCSGLFVLRWLKIPADGVSVLCRKGRGTVEVVEASNKGEMMSGESGSKDKRMLPVVGAGEGEGCSTCRSNDWIWDEEIALVRAMHGIKLKVREARCRRDDAAVDLLREEFLELRGKMERVRRQRLDSLGHFDYD